MSFVAGEVALPRTGSTGGISAAANRREVSGRRAGAAAADPWARYVPPQTNLQLGAWLVSRISQTDVKIAGGQPQIWATLQALRDAEAAQAVKESERRWA
ncbi:hypothetical protein KC359_g153 [Hortaea werneckii]|nr:hypothetical protein KC359_g153 [Hortaea werneckii]KAI7514863.1 hypothetical protein KC347_g147 [Hortaea werneckii]